MYNDDSINESLKWLKEREGFSPRPYSDYKQSSIGYGTGRTGLKEINKEDAEGLLQNEIINRRAQLGKDYPQGISNWAKLALDDRLYNAGVEGVRGSKFLGALKNLDEDEAERQLTDWNKVTVNGQKVEHPGLTNRINMLKAQRNPASERRYDSSKSPFTQSEVYDNLKNDPAFNTSKGDGLSYLQRLQEAKKYKDDGFRMAGVEGGAQPQTSIDLNSLFSNDNPTLNVLPKVQTETVQREIEPVTEQLPVMKEVNEPTQKVEGQTNELGETIEGQPLDNDNLKLIKQLVSGIDQSNVETTKDNEPKKDAPKSEVDVLNELLNEYKRNQELSSRSVAKASLMKDIMDLGSAGIGTIFRTKPVENTAATRGLASAKEAAGAVNTDLVNKLNIEKQKQAAIGNERDENYRQNYLQYLKDQLAQQEEIAKMRIDSLKEEKREKEEEKDTNRLDKVRKSISDIKGKAYEARAGIGGTASSLLRANNLLNILSSYERDGELADIQVQELANMTDTMLKQGGSAVKSAQKLVPYDIKSNLQKFKDFMTSKPNKTKRDEFLGILKQLGENERAGSLAQIRDYQVSKLGPILKPEYLKDEALRLDLSADDLLEPLEARMAGKPYNIFDKYLEKQRSTGHGGPQTGTTIERLDRKTGKIALYNQNKEFIGWK